MPTKKAPRPKKDYRKTAFEAAADKASENKGKVGPKAKTALDKLWDMATEPTAK